MKQITFETLQLKNFRCHEDEEFSFSPNRFVSVVGSNGAGKTSLFVDSILWALFDETSKGLTGDSIIRKKSKKDCSVILSFKIDDDEYEIRNYRKHSDFKNGKYIYKNGEDISPPTKKELNEFIENLIMPKQIFVNSLLFSQFLSQFTDLRHSTQKDILDKMLMFDKYDEIRGNIVEYIKLKKSENDTNINQVEWKKQSIEKITESLNSFIQNKQDKIKEIEVFKENSKSKILLLRNEIKELDQFVKNNSDKLDLQNDLKEQKQSKTVEYKNLEDNYKSDLNMKNVEVENKLREDKNSLHEKIASKSQQYYDQKSEITKKELELTRKKEKALETKKSELEQSAIAKLSTVSTEINSMSDKIRELSKTTMSLKLKQGELFNQKNNLSEKKETIEKTLNSDNKICPSCGQELKSIKSLHSDLKDITSQEKDLESKIKSISKELNEKESEILKFTEDVEKLKQSEIDIKEKYKSEYSEFKAKVDDKIQAEYLNIKKELFEIEKNINKIENSRNKKLEELEAKYSEIKTKVSNAVKDKYKQKKISLEKDMKELDESLNEINDICNEIVVKKYKVEENERTILAVKEHVKNTLDIYNSNLETIKQNISKCENEIKSEKELLETMESNIKEYIDEKDIVEFWKTAFSDSGIKSILLDEAIPMLNDKARELSGLTDVLNVSFDSQSTLKSGNTINKFSINVTQTQNLSDLSELSAGEARLSNIIVLLCLRYLLESTSNRKTNILILDEVFDGLDPDNVNVALQMITNLSKENCVILISHTLREHIESDEKIYL